MMYEPAGSLSELRSWRASSAASHVPLECPRSPHPSLPQLSQAPSAWPLPRQVGNRSRQHLKPMLDPLYHFAACSLSLSDVKKELDSIFIFDDHAVPVEP